MKFVVEATGDVLEFQWQKNGDDIHDHGSRYRGTDTNTLRILIVKKDDEGCYRCLVKNYIDEKFSDDVVLTVSKLILTCYTGLIHMYLAGGRLEAIIIPWYRAVLTICKLVT